MKKAYGGVVIDLSGQVLLREPVDSNRGVRWTFAKGKPKPGESPEETALREVWEETGVRAKILVKLAGTYHGSQTSSRYFLMLPLDLTTHHDEETLMVRWVDQEQAVALIAQTVKPNRRARDLRVLATAFAVFKSLVGVDEPAPSTVLAH